MSLLMSRQPGGKSNYTQPGLEINGCEYQNLTHYLESVSEKTHRYKSNSVLHRALEMNPASGVHEVC